MIRLRCSPLRSGRSAWAETQATSTAAIAIRLSDIVEQGHETEVHVELLVAVEQG